MESKTKFATGFLFSALLLAACNGGGDGGGGGTILTDADIQGTWTLKSMHEKGTETTSITGQPPVVENVDTLTTYASGSTMEFKADKTYTSQQDSGSISGTWSVSGDKLTIITTIPFFNIVDTAISVVTLSGKEGTFVETDKSTQTIFGITVTSNVVRTVKATKQ